MTWNVDDRKQRRAKLLARDGDGCCWCGEVMRRRDRTLEHLIPRASGGGNLLANLVLAHGECNRRRGRAPAATWAEIELQRSRQPRLRLLAERFAALELRLTVDGAPIELVFDAMVQAARLRLLAGGGYDAMPAATVSPLASSTRMNAPVGRSVA